MKLIKIKQVPPILVFLKIMSPGMSYALTPYIFLNKKLYQDYQSGVPGLETLAIIAHEKVHIERERKMGLFLFLMRYTFSKKFCFNEELHAIASEMRVYKICGKHFDKKMRARVLATHPCYSNCITYDKALAALQSLWEKTDKATT